MLLAATLMSLLLFLASGTTVTVDALDIGIGQKVHHAREEITTAVSSSVLESSPMNMLIPNLRVHRRLQNDTVDGEQNDYSVWIAQQATSLSTLRIVAITVATAVVVLLISSVLFQRKRVLDDLRLNHVTRRLWMAMILGSLTMVALAVTIFVILQSGTLDDPSYENGNEHSFCESIHKQSPVKTPDNTLSNVAFLISGWLIICMSISDYKAFDDENTSHDDDATLAASVAILMLPSISFLWGIMIMVVGIASGAYHATLATHLGYHDMGAIYTALAVSIIYNILRFMPWAKFPRIAVIMVYLLEAAVVILTILFNNEESSLLQENPNLPFIVVAAMIGGDILLRLIYVGVWPRKAKWNCTGIIRGIVCISVGAMAVLLKMAEVRAMENGGCPDSDSSGSSSATSYLQIHALFHICCAEALFLSYLITRSETIRDTTKKGKDESSFVETSSSEGMEVVVH